MQIFVHKNDEMQDKIAIYTRLSADQKESTSIENQIKQGKQFAKFNNLQPIVYNEGEGLSGKLPLVKRPVLSKLLSDMYNNEFDLVWFRDQERLERHPATLMAFVEAVRDTKTIVYIDDKKIDMDDSGNIFMMIIQSASNFQFADKRTKMSKKAAKQNAEEGKAFGSVPFGYTIKGLRDKTIIVHEENAKILQGFFNDYLNGKGTTSIAKELNRKGVETLSKNTSKWTDSTVLYMLKNKMYIGVRTYNKIEYENIPAIIDVDTFNKVQARIQQNGNRGNKGYSWLLNGLVKCGHCSEPMNGRSYSYRKYFYYMCLSQRYPERRCQNRSLDMEALDSLVWDSLFNNVTLMEKVKEGYKEGFDVEQKKELRVEIEQYRKNIIAIERKIEKVQDMVEGDIMTVGKAKTRITAHKGEIAETNDLIRANEAKLANLNNQRQLYDEIEKDFNSVFGGAMKHEVKESDKYDEKAANLMKFLKEEHPVDPNMDIDRHIIETGIDKDEKRMLLNKYIDKVISRYDETSNTHNVTIKYKIAIKDTKHYIEHNNGRTPRRKSTSK